MAKIEITNMIMVQNKATSEVLVQERIKYWCGVTFPGGHLEPDESIYDSAVREVREETGLEIANLKACGIIHWFNNITGDRYFVHCYYTSDYSGELIPGTDEGRVFWTNLDTLSKIKLSPNFDKYLPLFTEKRYSEIFCSWNEDMRGSEPESEPWTFIYR